MFGRNCRTIYMDPFIGGFSDTYSRPGYVRPDPDMLLEQLEESRAREANLRLIVLELREREGYYQDVVKQFQLRDAKLQSQIRSLEESLSETKKEAQKAIKEAEKARREARSVAQGKEKGSCFSEPARCIQRPAKTIQQSPSPQEIRFPVESFLSDLIREFTGVDIKPANLHIYDKESKRDKLDEQIRQKEEERQRKQKEQEEKQRKQKEQEEKQRKQREQEEKQRKQREQEEKQRKQREQEEKQRKQREQEEKQRKQREDEQREKQKKLEESKLHTNSESATAHPLDENVQKFMALLLSTLQAQQPYNPLFQSPAFTLYRPESSSNPKSNADHHSGSQKAEAHSAVSTPEDSEAENESISSMPASPVQQPQDSSKFDSESSSSSNLHKHPSIEEVEDEEFVTLRKKTSSQSQ